MLQSRPQVRPVGYQFSTACHDSDSDSSVISDRGCRPFTACKVAPAVATLASTASSSYVCSGTDTPAHYSTNTSTAPSLTCSPECCLKAQNGIQFVCPKPKRNGSVDSVKHKRFSICTPPPSDSAFNWSDSDDDEEYSRTEEDDDEDECDNANSVLYRRLMRRHSSVKVCLYDEEDTVDDGEQAMFSQDL